MDEVVYQTRNQANPWSLDTYRKFGGYQALEKIVREKIYDAARMVFVDAIRSGSL